MILAWVRLVSRSFGVAVVAASAQLGLAAALGIVRWGAAFDAGGAGAWRALLTWIAFVYAVAVVAGAFVGRRAVRRPGRADGVSARILACVTAALGAAAAITVAWLPARGVRAPLGTDPGLVVTITATAGVVAGFVVALVALSAAPVAGGIRTTVAWVALVGVGSAAAGLTAGGPYDAPRLAVVDAPSLIPVAWWSGPWLMVGVTAVVGLAVAGLARWGGAGRIGVALSGGAGPALVAAAYLISGPGDGQLVPYQASLAAAGAGLLASVLVAIPARRGAGPADDGEPAPIDHHAAGHGFGHANGGRHEVPDATAPEMPAAGGAPAAARAGGRHGVSAPVAPPASTGTVYASQSHPQTPIGRPPAGYEEYSAWLKDLSAGPEADSQDPVDHELGGAKTRRS